MLQSGQGDVNSIILIKIILYWQYGYFFSKVRNYLDKLKENCFNEEQHLSKELLKVKILKQRSMGNANTMQSIRNLSSCFQLGYSE